MLTYQLEHKHRQSSGGEKTLTPPAELSRGSIVVVPAQSHHVDAVGAIDEAAYTYEQSPDDPHSSQVMMEAFLHSLTIFPEGQFVAIDRETDQVVGRTASMRYHFDPTRSLRDSWAASTGDG